MKLKIYISILAISVLACKKKSEDSPSPATSTQTNNGKNTEQVCTWGEWIFAKKGADAAVFENGFLSLTSKHSKSGGSHIYTTISTTCTLIGDFELRLDVPYLSLSDSANKGSLFAQVFSNSKPYTATLGNNAASMGSNGISAYKFVIGSLTKASFTFKRNGSSLYSKLAYDGDSLESTMATFGTEPLRLVLGVLCDSAAKMPTQAHFEKLTVTGGGGSFKTDELVVGSFK